jgi:hypothetical protein
MARVVTTTLSHTACLYMRTCTLQSRLALAELTRRGRAAMASAAALAAERLAAAESECEAAAARARRADREKLLLQRDLEEAKKRASAHRGGSDSVSSSAFLTLQSEFEQLEAEHRVLQQRLAGSSSATTGAAGSGNRSSSSGAGSGSGSGVDYREMLAHHESEKQRLADEKRDVLRKFLVVTQERDSAEVRAGEAETTAAALQHTVTKLHLRCERLERAAKEAAAKAAAAATASAVMTNTATVLVATSGSATAASPTAAQREDVSTSPDARTRLLKRTAASNCENVAPESSSSSAVRVKAMLSAAKAGGSGTSSAAEVGGADAANCKQS